MSITVTIIIAIAALAVGFIIAKMLEKNYEVRDKQDVLAMCALQIASKNEVKNVYDDLDTKNVKNKLINMEQLIDSYL